MKKLASFFVLSVLLLPLAACDANDGPTEQLGEKIDNTADEIADRAEDTCEAISDKNC